MSEAVTEGSTEPVATPSPRRRSRLVYWSTRIVALLLGAILLSLIILNTPIGHRFVADRIAALEPSNGMRIKIGRIEGSLYSRATLRNVTLSDPKGAFVTIPVTELNWRPYNWFFSGLDIRELTAKRGTLLRVPELNPGDPNEPWLPDFDIRVDKFRLENFTVSEAVLGKKRRVDLSAKALSQKRRAYLRVDGQLGGGDRFNALLDSFPQRDRFDIDLDYRAPAGGLLAEMAGAKKDLRLRVVGDGTWTKWKGAFLAEHDAKRLAAFRLTNEKGQYGILGQVFPGDLIAGTPKDVLGEAVSLGASGTFADSVVNGAIRVQGHAIDANAKGALDLTNNLAKGVKIAGRLTRGDVFGKSMKVEGARFTVDLDGPFGDLTIPHTVLVDRIDAGTRLANVKQEGVLQYDGKSWHLPLNLTVGRIETGNGSVDPRLVNGRATGRLSLTGNDLQSNDLRIAFPGLKALFNLRGNIASGGYAIAGPVDASGITLENLGTLNGHAKIIGKLTQSGVWTLQANFAGAMPRVNNDTLLTVTGGNIRFRGGVTMGSNRPLLFEKVALDAAKLQMRLDGSVANGQTKVVGAGRHADYGPFTVSASVAGDGPRAELVFADPLPAAGLKDVHVALAPIVDGFGIDTKGQSMLGPFDGRLNLFMRSGGPTRIEIARMDVSQTSVTGTLTLVDGGASGNLALSGGGMDGTIALAPRGGGQGFDIKVAARNARFAGTTPLTIRSARIEATGVVGGKTMQANGSVFAQGISYGQLFIGRVAAKAAIVNGKGTFNASLTGRRGGRFSLQLQGTTASDRITLLGQGEFADRQISMPRRAVLTSDKGGWKLAPTQISYGDGIAIAEGRFGGKGPTDLKLQFANMSLSVVDIALTDMSLGGRVSGVVNYLGRDGAPPTGQAQLQIKGLTRSGLVLTSRPIDLFLVADLSERELQARAAVHEGGARRGRIQARISGLPRMGGLMERLNRGALFAQLRYDGPADALWRLAAIDGFDLTGPLDVAADVTGSLADPNVRGSLAGDALQFRSSLTGTDVRNIRARGTFSGSRLQLTSFAGTARNGGKVSGSGMIDIGGLDQGGPQMDIRIAAEDALVLNRKDMSASVTGPLRIVSDGQGGTIAGRLRIRKANWKLGSAAAVAAELPNIPTREINLPMDAAPRARRSGPWRFLIDAQGGSQLFVRGMGLDSEWSANISLRGTTSDPRIGGRADLERGTYEFAGTQFDLTRGRIAFDAGVPIDPRLDILAESKVDSLSVRVTVKGSASQPEIAFTSIPALPEEELLARMLFGGSVSDLSATDALQLGAALASLRGGGGMDPINKLRSAIGLDRLRIVAADPARDQGTAIAAGKNFGKRVYAEIITDGRGYSATQVEFRVTSWLSLLGSISTVGRESVLIKASHDY
ncbi:hypothetical protein NT2_05_03740 [Caenibius tardaugens NBRC 16725]|uniref:Translocation and assembly module TamB C-terminal domain-containing protein n=1 Tax=Caenibius tardaugens NBRC 16725 TaxID=1219035 RepID=U3A3X2_9SPHN|nr:translocation/assembly module TamB domain-containing protein [Caenibius tardaugens]AZI36776.1 DUF490 domain-containing protein [Caenibius tardaugens NBRC 16725]GAD49453.1 hypothetical protein NT2_05_03740 [Caenibius tardaugens NBRC 16725]